VRPEASWAGSIYRTHQQYNRHWLATQLHNSASSQKLVYSEDKLYRMTSVTTPFSRVSRTGQWLQNDANASWNYWLAADPWIDAR